MVGTRDHVLYADGLSMNSYDEVERHFRDIIRFQALQIALNENWGAINWGRTSATSGDDLAHLEKYVQRFKDTRFKNRLKNAIDEFYAYRRGKDNGLALGAEEALYETATFSVCRVPHFAEVRYGIHFKDTDEFGLYGMFVFDEPDKEPHSHFHRSDAGFEKESYLDDILIDEPV